MLLEVSSTNTEFAGTFDGQGHIKNVNIISPVIMVPGLFGSKGGQTTAVVKTSQWMVVL